MKLDLKAPHQVYRSSDGKKLTGVTTYCGVLSKPALYAWYAQMEREGVMRCLKRGEPLPVRSNGNILPFAEMKRDRAADLGTVTHARCEAWNKNDTLEPDGIPPDLYEQSVHGFERYKTWLASENLTVVAVEEQFVHETPLMSYGGTRDVVCTDRDGRRVLVDLKTSKASPGWPYDEVYAQVAAYAHPPEAEIDRIAVVRIGTTPEDDVSHVWLTQEQRKYGWRLFEGAYTAFEAKKALERIRNGKE